MPKKEHTKNFFVGENDGSGNDGPLQWAVNRVASRVSEGYEREMNTRNGFNKHVHEYMDTHRKVVLPLECWNGTELSEHGMREVYKLWVKEERQREEIDRAYYEEPLTPHTKLDEICEGYDGRSAAKIKSREDVRSGLTTRNGTRFNANIKASREKMNRLVGWYAVGGLIVTAIILYYAK